MKEERRTKDEAQKVHTLVTGSSKLSNFMSLIQSKKDKAAQKDGTPTITESQRSAAPAESTETAATGQVNNVLV